MASVTAMERLRGLAAERVMRRREPDPRPVARIGSVLKSDDEMRFTLAPLYAPSVEDAHGEYIEARDLQKAAHDYVRAGNLRLRLMHDASDEPRTVGDVVEFFTLPWDVEIDMDVVDKETAKTAKETVKLPAGTILTGVVWDEDAWPAVKDGRIGGISLGGLAKREDGDAVPERDSVDGDFVRVSVRAT